MDEHPRIEAMKTAHFGQMKLQRDRLFWPDGTEEIREYRVARRLLLNIVAMTDDCRLAFVRQYRHPVSEWTIELPGGSITVDDEPVWESALSILREETGFSAIPADVFPLQSPLSLAPTAMGHRVQTVFVAGINRITEPKIQTGSKRIETILLNAPETIRDPIGVLSRHGHVPINVLGSLMQARRSIRDRIKPA